ncbi:hypothetical protein NKOR_00675 [Candidatus Nitrosopumilus koreensis AR1]|uniref:GOLD domain-containing protein n=1 Tax=Candidatus Nitrosopumilus koreensis AR1 TaxID=1229908 RepID=K0B215_9ARCH|nr:MULTISPECIES: hypothetical protein [Nitrosopumilus]AFS80053.1 hypothetical protein NKOR_00675 [Candidatus Nitrosopumilus koreensis AR1]
MRISPFKLGLALVIVGMIWTAYVFDETEKKYDSIVLKQSNSFETESEFFGMGIGYFKLYIPEFSGEEVFVQILDPRDNVIQEQMVQTKMSVGYFDFKEDGKHTIKITNIAKNSIYVQIELGDTNSQEMVPSGLMIFVGAIVMLIISFFKIKNYSIEQPEENIS